MTQLDLGGHEAPAGVKLTHRQQLALDHVGRHQPVSSDEVGAVLHDDRLQRGGRGHAADARCDWCSDEGKQMLRRLRDLGLVKLERRDGWRLSGAACGDSPQDRGLQTDRIPY